MTTARSVLKTTLGLALRATNADRLIGALSGLTHMPLVLGYHRVVECAAPGRPSTLPGMVVSTRMLEQQLDWIGRRHRFVSLDELGAEMESAEDWTEPVAAVTFDDGYRDFYENALPMLMRKGIPAAVFVVSDWIGTPTLLPHDRLYLGLAHRWPRAWQLLADRFPVSINGRKPGTAFDATRSLLTTQPQRTLTAMADVLEEDQHLPDDAVADLQPMSWEMLHALQDKGITIGSHTRTHPVLTRERRASAADELVQSRRTLEERLHQKVPHVAYPNGAFDADTVGAARLAGYRFGYTACRHQDLANPLLTIPRRLLFEDSCLDARRRFSSALMSCLISGVFDRTAECRALHPPPATPNAG